MNTNEMSGVITVNTDGQFAYHIYTESSFASLPDAVKELAIENRRVVLVTDSNVEKLYLQEVSDLLRPLCQQLTQFVIPAGEEHKNLDEIRKLYIHLIEQGLDRKDLLVALGGGVVGDMTGFAASTYLRGIRFIQIPTTLLAQVDSSIGGKTGVDFEHYKNMVGAFHQPSLVYLNISALKSLPGRQYASGMAEVLKHGLIRDADYYEWMINHMEEIDERDPEVLLPMVRRSVEIKKEIVERDPKEAGERALLNFGHTAGHAIEKLSGFCLTHGECVALGSIVAAYISWKRGNLDEGTFFEIRDMFVGFYLPISFDSLEIEDILDAGRRDKKRDSGKIRFILLRELGEAYIDDTVTEDEIREALKSIDADLMMKE